MTPSSEEGLESCSDCSGFEVCRRICARGKVSENLGKPPGPFQGISAYMCLQVLAGPELNNSITTEGSGDVMNGPIETLQRDL